MQMEHGDLDVQEGLPFVGSDTFSNNWKYLLYL